MGKNYVAKDKYQVTYKFSIINQARTIQGEVWSKNYNPFFISISESTQKIMKNIKRMMLWIKSYRAFFFEWLYHFLQLEKDNDYSNISHETDDSNFSFNSQRPISDTFLKCLGS